MADGPLFLSALVFGALHLAVVIGAGDRLPAALSASYVLGPLASAFNHGTSDRRLRAADRAIMVAGLALDAADARGVPPWSALAAALYLAGKVAKRAGSQAWRVALHAAAHAAVTRGHVGRAYWH